MTTRSVKRAGIGITTLSLATILLCGSAATAGTSGSDSLPKKILQLDSEALAHPRFEFSTRGLADQLGIDSAVIWYSFGVRANRFVHSPRTEYCSPDTPEIRQAADSILERMQFERPGGRKRTVYYRMTLGTYPPYPGIPVDSAVFPESSSEHFVHVSDGMKPYIDTGEILFALRFDSTGSTAQVVVQSLSGSQGLLEGAVDEAWERKSSQVPPSNHWIFFQYLRSGRMFRETSKLMHTKAGQPVQVTVAVPDLSIPTDRDLGSHDHPLEDVTESVWQSTLDSLQLDSNGRPLTCASSASFTYPEIAQMEPPDYPRAEKYGGVQGTAKVECVINAEGKVVLVRIAKSTGNSALNQAAADAAYKCRFDPATCESTPAPCVVSFKYEFSLRDY
jgi:TonB family protein